MKKIYGLGLVFVCTLALAACGNSADKKNDTKSSESKTEQSTKKSSSTSKSSTKKEEGDFVKNVKDAYFDGTVLKGNTYTIKITDHKIIQPGEKGNEHSDVPVIAFWYDTLVAPDYDNSQPIDASLAWIGNFSAYQDNDPNKENKLNVASLPDEQFLDSQSAKIKPGGKVANAIAYELSDTQTPVTLKAATFNKEFGKKDFPLQ